MVILTLNEVVTNNPDQSRIEHITSPNTRLCCECESSN